MASKKNIEKYKKASKSPKKKEKSPARGTSRTKNSAPPQKSSAKRKDKSTAQKATLVEVKKEVSVRYAVDELHRTHGNITEETRKSLAAKVKIVTEVKKSSPLVKDGLNPTNCNRDQLIVEYAALIKYIAQKIAARLPANIELDDLMSSGVIGLMDAIDKYDSSRDNKFKTYAEFRIRGAILDELRAQDWVPRSVREKAKLLERVYARIEVERGRQATDDEVCEELGISQEEYHDLLNEVRSVSLLSYDDYNNFSKADKRSFHGVNEASGKVPTPFSEVTDAYTRGVIAEAIKDLPEKQRLVLSLYYYEDLNLKEIGKVLDVTESRVSQLHTQAILKLKARLKASADDSSSPQL